MLDLFRADVVKALQSADENIAWIGEDVIDGTETLEDMPEKALKSPFALAGWLYKSEVITHGHLVTRNEVCAHVAKLVVKVTRDYDRFTKRQGNLFA